MRRGRQSEQEGMLRRAIESKPASHLLGHVTSMTSTAAFKPTSIAAVIEPAAPQDAMGDPLLHILTHITTNADLPDLPGVVPGRRGR